MGVYETQAAVVDNNSDPVYPSSDPSIPEKSYTELDDAVNKIYQEKHKEYSAIFAHHNTSVNKVKEAAWKDAVKEMKRLYDEQGQYTPFMEERERRLQTSRLKSNVSWGIEGDIVKEGICKVLILDFTKKKD